MLTPTDTPGVLRADVHYECLARGTLPEDHSYLLWSALAQALEARGANPHGQGWLAPLPLEGRVRAGRLLVPQRGALRVRADTDRLPALATLVGQTLSLGSCRLALGTYVLERFKPSERLFSHCVTITLRDESGRRMAEPEAFAEAVERRLGHLGIERARVVVGPRRVVRVREVAVPGFELRLGGLGADDSLLLQERGLGARRSLGCGLFTRPA